VAAAYYRKALQSLPLFLGSGALMQVVVCGTFFDEFSSLEKHQKVFFSVGLALVMLGMVVTSMAGEEPQAHLAAGSKGDRFESLLERGHGSISSADLLLLGDIQKSALCWGRYEGLAFAAPMQRHASEIIAPLNANAADGGLHRAASAPPGICFLDPKLPRRHS
ncbi:unnamed protein product, partial [Effrenium voratum]